MRSAPSLGGELEARLGTPKRAKPLGSSPRSEVWRARFGGTSAVIKHLIAGDGADDRFAREVAALRAASAVRPPVLPRLLGADPAEHTLVTEYVEWWTVSARDRLAYRLSVVGGLGRPGSLGGPGVGPLGETARLTDRMRAAMLGRWPGLRPLPTQRP